MLGLAFDADITSPVGPYRLSLEASHQNIIINNLSLVFFIP